jgi:hypothetical protein
MILLKCRPFGEKRFSDGLVPCWGDKIAGLLRHSVQRLEIFARNSRECTSGTGAFE